MSRKPTHYPDGNDLHWALSRILDPRTYEVRFINCYEPADYGEALDAKTRGIVAEFLEWLGNTRGGDGLTSESEADFKARVEVGVRVTREPSGTVVIRVPRGTR